MVSVLLLSHGGLARELLDSAATIAGGAPAWMSAVCLDWDATFEEARRQTEEAIADLNPEESLLILTDMYGGTPFNVATSFAEPPAVQVLAGANLPMVLRLCCLGNSRMSAEELVPWLEAKGRRSICHRHEESRVEAAGCSEPDDGESTP